MTFDRFVSSVHLAFLLLCCALLGALIWCAVRGARLIEDADHAAQNANHAVYVAGAAATDLQKTLAIERAAALSQIEQAGQAEAAVARSANSLDALVRHTDTSLNAPVNGLLPALAALPLRVTPLLAQAQTDLAGLDRTNRTANAAIANFDLASGELARQLPPILSNVQAAAGGTVRTSQNLAEATAQIAATTADVHAYVHRITAPERGFWHFLKSLLWPTAQAAQIATAVK